MEVLYEETRSLRFLALCLACLRHNISKTKSGFHLAKQPGIDLLSDLRIRLPAGRPDRRVDILEYRLVGEQPDGERSRPGYCASQRLRERSWPHIAAIGVEHSGSDFLCSEHSKPYGN